MCYAGKEEIIIYACYICLKCEEGATESLRKPEVCNFIKLSYAKGVCTLNW